MSMYEMKQPILGKILLLILLVVILGGVGFGGWYFYNKLVKTPTGNVPTVNTVPKNNANVQAPAATENTVTEPVVNTPATSTEVTANMNNDKILFGESVDTDKDGLDDVREKEIGTDPNKPDTDSDGLKDGDEVIIWKTDPLKADTDGDGYKDGDEIKNGYNPLGAGKLFNVPAVTSTNGSAAPAATTTK